MYHHYIIYSETVKHSSLWKRSYLFHICIIKKYPFGTLGMKRKGTIMSAGVADHADKVKFTIFGIFISNPIKKLFKK